MRYTLLAVNERGVALWDYHARRLAIEPGTEAHEVWTAFGREAEAGVWAVWIDHSARLRVERRPGTRLRDGMPARSLPSPLERGAGPIPKPPPPGPYAPLRLDGTATLLTSNDGFEIYEACSAAVLGWDGGRLVVAPPDRPRVASTAEAAIREHARGGLVEAPIPTRGMPILLVNAVKATCTVSAPGRDDFPSRVRREIDDVLASLTRRP